MKKLISILFALFFIFGCDPEDDGNSSHPDEGLTALVEIENPAGFAEAASCLKRGDINLTAMDADYKQLNDYNTTTKDDLGAWDINADVLGIKARTGFRGYCFRETADGYVYMSMDVYGDLAANMNVNIPGTIQGELSTYYKDDVDHPAYNNRELALGYAKDSVLDYFGLSGYTDIDFSTATIQGDTTNDAVMAIISAAVDSRHATGPEMNDDISAIANGIYSGDLTLKTAVISARDSLKIKDIKTRVTSIAGSCPPIWEFSPHQEYKDLLFRTPDILESFSLDSVSACTFDTDGFNSFAYPIIFGDIENAKYFASGLTGDLSVWSSGICNQGTNYDCPSVKILDVSELNEILLTPYVSFNGSLGIHGLISGNQYFIVQEFSTDQRPSHACDSDMVQFGRILAAVDNNWQTAIGWNNVTSWFRRMPKVFTTN